MSEEIDIHLSKTLSWLLRHSAKQEGFHVSPTGYVPIAQILEYKKIKGKYTLADITRVVDNDRKKRFILKRNPELVIKACQGHSFPIACAELIHITEPIYDTVVHGTYSNAWPSIRLQGLSCCTRQYIHLAKGTLKDRSVISGLRRDVEVYIYINLRKALDDGIKFYESENGVILTEGNTEGYLKPEYFSKVVRVDTGEELYP